MQDAQIVGRYLGDVGLVVLAELDRDPVDGFPDGFGADCYSSAWLTWVYAPTGKPLPGLSGFTW